MGANGTVELIEKTDATANLRGGSKGSPELLATGIQGKAVERNADVQGAENSTL